MDSTIWNEFAFRPDDIVIASYAKSGTTWLQKIVAQLIFGGRDDLDVAALSPWLDARLTPKEEKIALLEAQQYRRFIKTHLPADALRFSPQAKHIYIARDGRDVVWSLHNHHAILTGEFYRLINDKHSLVGPLFAPPLASIRRYFIDAGSVSATTGGSRKLSGTVLGRANCRKTDRSGSIGLKEVRSISDPGLPANRGGRWQRGFSERGFACCDGVYGPVTAHRADAETSRPCRSERMLWQISWRGLSGPLSGDGGEARAS